MLKQIVYAGIAESVKKFLPKMGETAEMKRIGISTATLTSADR
jgi:hypothetical protein